MNPLLKRIIYRIFGGRWGVCATFGHIPKTQTWKEVHCIDHPIAVSSNHGGHDVWGDTIWCPTCGRTGPSGGREQYGFHVVSVEKEQCARCGEWLSPSITEEKMAVVTVE